MRVKSLKLKNYRNYDDLNLTFDKKTNILYGDNAQGKTNILEALYLSGTTKSHRSVKDKDMIKFEKEQAHIEVNFEKESIDYTIDIHLKSHSSKGIAINKVPIKKASDLFGMIHFVFFSPEDLSIIKEGPAVRRKFIDIELSQLDKIYLHNLSNYDKTLRHRNKLLKELQNNRHQLDLLDVWDGKLAEFARTIINERKIFIRNLNEITQNIHSKLTNNLESLSITYEANVESQDILCKLGEMRQRDIRLGTTTVGPHRDDLLIQANDIDLRRYGSQGQQRTAALSMKLAEIELVIQKMGDTPILLLDDVLSELDKNRQHFLLESIKHIQTLITCTGLDEFINHRFALDKVFLVKNGTVSLKKDNDDYI